MESIRWVPWKAQLKHHCSPATFSLPFSVFPILSVVVVVVNKMHTQNGFFFSGVCVGIYVALLRLFKTNFLLLYYCCWRTRLKDVSNCDSNKIYPTFHNIPHTTPQCIYDENFFLGCVTSWPTSHSILLLFLLICLHMLFIIIISLLLLSLSLTLHTMLFGYAPLFASQSEFIFIFVSSQKSINHSTVCMYSEWMSEGERGEGERESEWVKEDKKECENIIMEWFAWCGLNGLVYTLCQALLLIPLAFAS